MADRGREPENQQTRREFVRKVARKSAYAVPLIITFSKANLARSHVPSGGRRYHDSQYNKN